MSTGSHFSKYESPNIIIVPNMSCNPPSPKRQKLGNTTLVSIGNNATGDIQKLKTIQENKKCDNSDTDKKLDINQSSNSAKNPPKDSWASNYLQSIGLDKKSSIWNRKIPRKTTPQRCVDPIELPEMITAKITRNSTYAPETNVEKSKQLESQKKCVTNSNISNDSKIKTEHLSKTETHDIIGKSLKDKQSKHESTNSVLVIKPSAAKRNKTTNILSCKKIRTLKTNTEPIESHKQSIDICTSAEHRLHTKSEKVINVKSQKGRNSTHLTKHSTVSHSHKSQCDKNNPNIKPIVIKQNHVQNDSKNSARTKHNQIKRQITKPSANYTSSNYKEKHKNLKCSMENITSIKNVTKKYDIRDVSKLDVLKTAQDKPDIKSRDDCNKAEISEKAKNNEKITNIKSNPKPNKKPIETPIKKNTPKTKGYRKIKLVINVICNNNTNPQKCNESSSNENHKRNTTCTVPNVDLDFLNDFDIDEIVESLHTCEKETSQYIQSHQDLDNCQSKENIGRHDVTSNIHTSYNNTDALDLIKTLKGEEDDDLMRISIENATDSLFSSDLDIGSRDSHVLNKLSKSNNTNFTISKHHPTRLVNIKEEEHFEILPIASSSTACDLKPTMINKKVGHADNTCNIHKSMSKNDVAESSSDGVQKRILCVELDDDKNNSNNLKNVVRSINFSHAVKADISHKKERAIETPHTIIGDKAEESKHNIIQSSSESVTKGSRSIELDENKNNSNDSKNAVRSKTVGHADRSYYINKNERMKETQRAIIRYKSEYSKHNVINFSSDNVKKRRLSLEFEENKNNNIDLKKGVIRSKHVSHSDKVCINKNEKSKESKHFIVQSSSDSVEKELDKTENDFNNVIVNNNLAHADETCSINKIETLKEHTTTIQKHPTTKNKGEESKHDVIMSSTDNVKKSLSIELNENKNNINTKVKDESNINQVICDADSPSLKIDTEIGKKIELHEAIKENINQEKIINNNLLDQQSAEKIYNEDQIENRNSLNYYPNDANVDKFIDKKLCKNISNISKIEVNNKDLDNSINEREKKDILTEVIHHPKLGKPRNDCQKYAGQEEKAVYYDEKCIETNKAVKDSDDQKGIYANNPNNHQEPVQGNSAYASPVKNNEEQNKIALNSSIVKEVKISGENVQIDKHENDKNESHVEDDFITPKQKDLTDNIKGESPRNLCNNEENTRGNIKSKADLQSILKLEERLLAESGSKYSIVSIIHTGKFSKIFKCQHPNGKSYALKMPTANIKYYFGKEKKEMLNALISDIPENNLFIICLVKAFNMAENWCFLMEYYPKNLDQALREIGKPLSIEHIQDFARQLVMAVMVLKNKNMVHLDIKPKHILINSSNNMLKLSGFDTLCYINKMRVLPNTGTVNYRAPEVILGYESGFEIDVWSTGLVLYEMAVHRKLFPGTYNNDILYKQMCTLGWVPYDMIKKSRFNRVHFEGSKFMRKSGFRGQTINIVSKFQESNRLSDSIYDAYYGDMDLNRVPQQNCDIGKLSLFVKLLQKMLTIHPESRLPIEFVYSDPFIYDAYAYQEW